MIRYALSALLLLTPAVAFAQTLAERFEASAKRERSAAISHLEKRIEDRKSLVEAAKRGLINQPKNDYSSATAPDGQILHNFTFRTAADRKDQTTRYQKQLTDASRDLKDLKAETAWPCSAKSIRELEVGDFVWLEGQFRIALKETENSAWIEKLDRDNPGSFLLTGADLSRYADDKLIDFIDAKHEVLFWVKGTRPKPESLRVNSTSGQTLYELQMISAEQLTKQLPAGIRILKLAAPSAADLEQDLPTPEAAPK
jgi:hypothetical protein